MTIRKIMLQRTLLATIGTITLGVPLGAGGIMSIVAPAQAAQDNWDRSVILSVEVESQNQSFNLKIVSTQSLNQSVTARVSVKPSNPRSLMPERLLGDYRYQLQGRQPVSNLIRGVQPGDRIAVSLFNRADQLIGFTEFNWQTTNSTVTLRLSGDSLTSGGVRLISGDDLKIDDNRSVKPPKSRRSKFNQRHDRRQGDDHGRRHGSGCDDSGRDDSGRSRSRHGGGHGRDD